MKRDIIICSSLILVLVLFGLLFYPLHQRVDLTELRNCTAVITDGVGHGTAFFVSPHLLLTAKHVPDNNDMYVLLDDGTEVVILERWDDPNNDMALVKVDYESKYFVPIEGSDLVLDFGQKTFWYGTPLDIRAHDCYREGTVVLGVGVEIPGWWDDVFFMSGFSFGGDSGSPVFCSNGELVGVLVGGGSQYNLTRVEPINDLSVGLLGRILEDLND